ncbi:GNAT family N-acetyltransferase [Rhodovibrionaceae bacterium A322]
MGDYKIRTMTRADLDIAVDWAAAEGWNPGLHDAEAFYAADPDGFFIGELDGEPIACISAVRYPDNFAFLGFYIVKPEARGKGYGLAIWKAAMRHLEGYNIGLDGVLDQQANYKRSGFAFQYSNARYEGLGGGSGADGLISLDSLDKQALAAFDQSHFAVPRAAFLDLWIKQPAGTALAKEANGEIVGYGIIRACREGHKIGPLFARDAEVAEDLFKGLIATVPGDKVYLDVPLVNPAALALAKSHNMEQVFETARMYTDGDPGLPIANIFGVTTFELG